MLQSSSIFPFRTAQYIKANRVFFRSLQAILDCSEANEGFYVKCGYKRAGLEMAHYY